MEDSYIESLVKEFKDKLEKIYSKGFHDGYKHGQDTLKDSYQLGLDDAWDIVKKLCLNVDDGGLNLCAIDHIYGYERLCDIITNYEPESALNMMKCYEDTLMCETCEHRPATDSKNFTKCVDCVNNSNYSRKSDHCKEESFSVGDIVMYKNNEAEDHITEFIITHISLSNDAFTLMNTSNGSMYVTSDMHNMTKTGQRRALILQSVEPK